MKGIFSPDSKLMILLGYVADVFMLNILFIVSCIPFFTIGAAATALYTVCFRFNTQREGSVFKDYLRAFCSNFKQATAIWMILLVLLVVSCVDLYAAGTIGGIFYQIQLLFWGVLILSGFLFSFVFPTPSQFHNTVKGTLKNALLLSLSNIPKAFLLTVLNFLPLLVLALDTALFLELYVVL